jgi:hypothetical protein
MRGEEVGAACMARVRSEKVLIAKGMILLITKQINRKTSFANNLIYRVKYGMQKRP